MRKRWYVKRSLVIVVSVFVLFVVSGWCFQALSERRDLLNHPPLGELLDLGTHRLHLHCLGAGSPTVILEAGLGNGVLHWSKVQSEISRFTKVCAYDRSGLGHSEAGPLPRSGTQITSELEDLIMAAGLEIPLVLVGHSNGALYARLLASRRPDWVAGIVMVDPNPENAPSCEELPKATRWIYGSLVALAPFGVPRLVLPYVFPLGNSLPKEARTSFSALRARTDSLRALWSEWRSTCGLRNAVREAGSPPSNIPVIVLSAQYSRPGIENAATKLHRKMVEEYPDAEFILVEKSKHWIQLDRPDVVIETVKRLIDSNLH